MPELSVVWDALLSFVRNYCFNGDNKEVAAWHLNVAVSFEGVANGHYFQFSTKDCLARSYVWR